LRLIVASWDFWLASDAVGELEGRLTQLLEQYKGVDSLRARSLVVYSHLLADIGNFAKSHKIAKQSLELSRAISDRQAEASSLFRLGWISGDGSALIEKSIALFRKIGDKRNQALAMVALGQSTKNPEQSKAILLEALQLHRELNYAEGIAKCQSTLAGQYIWDGDFSSAIPLLDESLEIYRQLGNHGGESHIFGMYGSIAYWQGDFQQAYTYFHEAVKLRENDGTFFSLWPRIRMAYALFRTGNISQSKEIFVHCVKSFQKVGLTDGVVFSIEGLAGVFAASNKPKVVALLIGWADATRDDIEDTRPLVEQQDMDKIIESCLKEIGEASFSDEYEAGRKMSMDDIIAFALYED